MNGLVAKDLTVRDLIAALRELPPDLSVVVVDGELGYQMTVRGVQIVESKLEEGVQGRGQLVEIEW